MPNFDLATAAEEDLKKIALYTISKWGGQQAVRYGALLDAHFEAIGNGKAKTRIIMPRRPDLRVSRIRHHYVFHLEREKRRPLILAVFHKNMDLMARLRDRLEE